MLSLLCERQVTSCASSTGIENKIGALAKQRKRKKIQFATMLKCNPDLRQHILLGFTADGEHLLSCSTDAGEDFDEEEEEPREMFSPSPVGHCCLHWWRLPLKGYAMTKAREMSVFDGCAYSSNHCLDVLEIPHTDWLVSHSWMFSAPSSHGSSTHDPAAVRCALSLASNPLRGGGGFEIVLAYSKDLTTPPVPLPLALSLPGCAILDLTHCVCVVCYDGGLAAGWSRLDCAAQPWLANRIEKYCNLSDDGVIAWQTLTVHIRSSKHGGGGGGGGWESNSQSLACNEDGPADLPPNPAPHCIGRQHNCIAQQVLDVEKWLVSELCDCLKIHSIGFYFILDYAVHIEEVCAVTDSIALTVQALISGGHQGRMRNYSLQMGAVWNVRLGMVAVKDKVFVECSYSKLLQFPAERGLSNPSLLDTAHHLHSRPGSGTGPQGSLLKLCHPSRPLEMLLTCPSNMIPFLI